RARAGHRVLRDAEQAEVEPADPPGQLRADADVDRLTVFRQADAAREERQSVRVADAPEGEDVRIAQEELPLLREEQVETREIDLARVDGGAGEIGVERQRGGECGRRLVEDVERGLEEGIARAA